MLRPFPKGTSERCMTVTTNERSGEDSPSVPPATTDDRPPSASTIDPSVARRMLLIADLAAIVVAFAATFVIQRVVRPVADPAVTRQLVIAIVTTPVWVVAIVSTRLLDARATEKVAEETRRIMSAAMIIVAAIVAVGFAVKFDALSRLWVGLTFVAITTSLALERWAARRCFARLRSTGRLRRRIVIVGDADHARDLAASVSDHPGYDLLGHIGDVQHLDALSGNHRPELVSLGHLDDAERILDAVDANGVIISLASLTATKVNRLARRLTDLGYHVALSSSLVDIDVARLRTQAIDGSAMFYIEPTIRNGWRASAKRAFDVTVAATTLLLSAPVLAIAAVAIKATSPGSVVFRQTRVGKDGREFSIYKLRTMVQDAEQRRAELAQDNEADGPLFKMTNDPRVTAVGRFLRTTSIDELPQCVNVLLGHMSVVGPRPALPSEVAQWGPEVHERLRVLPGITGLWQVSGRSDANFESYQRFDLYYVDNWSLLNDIGIVARTVGVVIGARGAR